MLTVREDADVILQIVAFSGILFVCCMICHRELSRLKPHPRCLTGYYLMISLGGALGGVFVTLIAPVIFLNYLELHVGLLGTGALSFLALYKDNGSWFHQKRVSWGVIPLITVYVIVAALFIATPGQHIRPPSPEHGISTVSSRCSSTSEAPLMSNSISATDEFSTGHSLWPLAGACGKRLLR